jgi:hypothetical protein
MDELSPELKQQINTRVKRDLANWKRIKRIVCELTHANIHDQLDDKAPPLIKEMHKLLQEIEQ